MKKGRRLRSGEAWFPSREVQWTRLSAGPFSKKAREGAHPHIDSIGEWSGSRVIYTTVKTVKHVTLQPGQLRI
jgi:hypothetical protein